MKSLQVEPKLSLTAGARAKTSETLAVKVESPLPSHPLPIRVEKLFYGRSSEQKHDVQVV